MAEEKQKNLDIWLVLVIILLVLSIGGGLWLTATSVLSRLDSLSIQTRSQVSKVEAEVFELRKELQNLEFMLKKQTGVPTAAEPAKAEPQPKKAEPKKAEPKKAEPKKAEPAK